MILEMLQSMRRELFHLNTVLKLMWAAKNSDRLVSCINLKLMITRKKDIKLGVDLLQNRTQWWDKSVMTDWNWTVIGTKLSKDNRWNSALKLSLSWLPGIFTFLPCFDAHFEYLACLTLSLWLNMQIINNSMERAKLCECKVEGWLSVLIHPLTDQAS